jgi:hypothetical protein
MQPLLILFDFGRNIPLTTGNTVLKGLKNDKFQYDKVFTQFLRIRFQFRPMNRP